MFSITRALSIVALGASVAACGGAASDPIDDGIDPSNPPEEGLDATGTYTVHSAFELDADELGKNGELGKRLKAMADDPIGEIAEVIADELGGLSFLEGPIEQLLEEVVDQEMADKISSVLGDMADITVSFDVVSELDVAKAGSGYKGLHSAKGMLVVIDGKDYEYSFDSAPAEGLTVTLGSNGMLTFPEHQLEIPYAEMILTILDTTVIPEIDADAQNLGEALANAIDCDKVGVKLEELGLFDSIDLSFLQDLDASDYAGFCEKGLEAAGDKLYDFVADMDGLTLAITVSGDAKGRDVNGDRRIDSIEGSWKSQIDVLGSIGAIDFKGQRN
jgi:hypothetical protein